MGAVDYIDLEYFCKIVIYSTVIGKESDKMNIFLPQFSYYTK